MADKRKAATGKPARGGQGVKKRRRGKAAVGRIARPREASEYRGIAMDEHSVQVREQIDAALSEALRLREDITQRIASGVYRETTGLFEPPSGESSQSAGVTRRSRASRK
ncbi:hypothetical protein [Melittangium boletus]|uniref:Uncharacterized protein n=1 Tax=Melittangium boletus DSM 14713 TaxID=1294270 RepID=A0A250IG61_9BACT|nr:hypothetical protein [Melittangium boletus]ATB30141.1 hypothetical protein MEBOL_003596 [Melittangium boletus DSM 14713]